MITTIRISGHALFSYELAKILGLNQAILLSVLESQISDYETLAKRDEERYNDIFRKEDGRCWIGYSVEGWRKSHLTFWSAKKIRRSINELEKQGIIIGKKLAKEKRDQTKWLTIDYEKLREVVEKRKEEIE